MKLQEKIIDFLKQNPGQKYMARSIAQWIVANYPQECRQKLNRSPALHNKADLVKQLAAEIRPDSLRKKVPGISTTVDRPRKIYYPDDDDSVAPAKHITPVPATGGAISEQELYPLLCDFLSSELDVISKRIDEKRSRNSRGAGGNEWLYPDLVGMEDLGRDWHREISACVKQYSDKKTTLWSFEVKKLVNRSNIRRVFFQAVSNSSWANFGYLVASEIEGSDTLKEMRILAGLHGIGFIKLEVGNPSASQITIPARERKEIDWNIANRLAEENRDFLDYIKLVRQFYQTGDFPSAGWDV